MAEDNALFEWVKKVLSSFLQETQTEYPYKLVDYNYAEKERKFLITVQLKYKDIKQDIDPEVFLKDDNLVRMMSPENIRLITYLACKNNFAVMYQVVNQNFHGLGLEKAIEIRHVETKKIETKLVGEILSDKNYLHRMHPEEVFKIGFAAGATSITNEQVKLDDE
jgi:hypothetical protein